MKKGNSPLFCDVLPIHPPLKPDESLSSYCTRLGQENLIKSVAGISYLLFPETDKRQILDLSDLPPMKFSTIATASTQSPERILESTFYYLGKNFGRTPSPQALSRFLHGSISPTLRYCPYCVNEKHYYSIFWRFTHIVGCEKHNCKLLELCPHCGKKIPLFCSPFRIGKCPLCNYVLADVPAINLTTQEIISTQSLIEDLKIYLSPNKYPHNFSVGNIIRIFRLYSQIPLAEIASKLNVRQEKICYFETYRKNAMALKFNDALSYVKILDLPFHKMVSLPFITNTKGNMISLPVISPEGKIRNFTEAIYNNNVDSTQSLNHVIKPPKPYKKISQEDLRLLIINTKKRLIENGEELTNKNIAKKAKISKNILYYYPEIRELLPNQSLYKNPCQKNTATILLNKISEVYDDLMQSRNILTYTHIQKTINFPIDTLLYYHSVRSRLDEIIEEQRIKLETSYIILLENKFIVGISPRSKILKELNIGVKRLKHYPKLENHIKNFEKKSKPRKTNIMKHTGSFENIEGKQIEICREIMI